MRNHREKGSAALPLIAPVLGSSVRVPIPHYTLSDNDDANIKNFAHSIVVSADYIAPLKRLFLQIDRAICNPKARDLLGVGISSSSVKMVAWQLAQRHRPHTGQTSTELVSFLMRFSALEADGRGKILTNLRVVAADQVEARPWNRRGPGRRQPSTQDEVLVENGCMVVVIGGIYTQDERVNVACIPSSGTCRW